LLGPFRCEVDGTSVEERRWSRRKAKLLIKLLALQPHHQLHREQLIETLWPELDSEAAVSNFNNILYAARRALEPHLPSRAESRFVVIQEQQILLRAPGKLWIDVDAFEQRADRAFKSDAVDDYEAALELYGGDLLPEDPYEDWANTRRESLRLKHRKLLSKLAAHHERNNQYEHGIKRLEELIACDETNEEAQRRLMRLYALGGARSEALRQYKQCCDALRRLVDAAPQRATVQLYEQIVAGKIEPLPSRDNETERPPRTNASTSTSVIARSASEPTKEIVEGSARRVLGKKAPPNNLPQPLTSFIGREAEIAEVRHAISSTRLLTLTGIGGMGKTRLALHVAACMLDEFEDGIWLVEMAALASPALVPQAVASALGVRDQQGEPLLTTLSDFLRPKSLLLVLDNCEHLVEACATLVEALLRACPNLRVLTTSREALGITGETLWRVPSLSLPETEESIETEALLNYEAARLFVERARLIHPDFQLTQPNAQSLAQLCRRLDGIPLALELAAARAKVLSVEQMLLKLDDRFRLLTGGSRTAQPRQQTLRAALDWSYNLLPESERVLLSRLSVFAGGCSLEAAEAVCAGGEIETGAMLDLLMHLVDKSLLNFTQQGAETRYRMLETIRQYAAEKLQASGEEAQLAAQHGSWFLQLAEEAEQLMWQSASSDYLVRLEAEHDNFRAALRWSIEHAEVEMGLRIAGALWRFWEVRGYLNEGRKWMETLLELEAGREAAPLVRAKAFSRAGAIARDQGDYSRGIALLEEGLALYRQQGDKWGAASALNGLGDAAHQQGDYAQATLYWEESLKLFVEIGDKRATAYLLHNLGNLAKDQSDYQRATTLHRKALPLFEELGDRRAAAYSLFNLAEISMYEGDLERAAALQQESLSIKRELGDKRGMTFSLCNLGDIARFCSDYQKATAFYLESLTLSREIGDKRSLAFCLEGLAETACEHGESERSARLFGAAETLREAIGAPLPQVKRTDYDRCISALRTALADESFRTAHSQGRAMNVEQSIALALAQTIPS
jgi:predicted ATPase/DNA-binding SARP family transcriptional activator